MTSVILDTNVVLSFLTDRNASQQRQSASLIESVGPEISLVVHQQVLTEMVYVLVNHYGQSRALVRSMIEEFLALPATEVVDTVSWPRVLKLWPESYRDFTDAVLGDLAATRRHAAVATFDEVFARRLGRNGVEVWDFRS